MSFPTPVDFRLTAHILSLIHILRTGAAAIKRFLFQHFNKSFECLLCLRLFVILLYILRRQFYICLLYTSRCV